MQKHWLDFFLFFSICSLMVFCSCSHTQKQPPAAKTNYTDSLQIAMIIKKADSLKLSFDYDSAFTLYQSAIKLSKSQNDSNELFLCYVKTAELFRAKSAFGQAEHFLNQANDLLIKVNIDSSDLMFYFNRRAALAAEYYRNNDTVLFYTNKALRLAQILKDTNTFFSSTMEIGLIFENNSKWDESVKRYQKALAIAQCIQSPQMQCDAITNCCRVFKKTGDYGSLKSYAEAGYKIAKSNSLLFSNLIFAQYLSDVAYQSGNYAIAHNYLWERLDLTDIYFKKRYDEKLIETETRYNVVEKEKEIAVKELEIIEKQNYIYNQKMIIVFVAVFLLLSVVFAVVLIYFYRKVSSQNEQLNFLNEQNKFLVSETNHRVNNNLQLISIFIYDEIAKTPAQHTTPLNKLLLYIDSMALLHKQLYQKDDKRLVDIDNYLNDILQNLRTLIAEKEVTMEVSFQKITVESDKAMYLGLLVNELVINSLKHAFANTAHRKIAITLQKNVGTIALIYQDNGAGISGNIAPKVISKICKQLGGDYQLKSNNGYYFYIAIAEKN